jgi:RNA polymerase sigma-70 factor (ECF subfamily)
MPPAGASDEPTDADLMRRTAAGDREAFAAVYRRHHGSIFRFARLMTGSSAIAEDVVQEAFLVLMRDASRFAPERAQLSTYLFGIARHLTRRRLLRERRFVGLSEDDCGRLHTASAPGSVADDMIRACEMAQLRRAILALPSRYREVVIFCDLQDVTYADAAATLGCAVGTIRSRLHRARQLLADKIRRSGTDTLAASSSRMRCAV